MVEGLSGGNDVRHQTDGDGLACFGLCDGFAVKLCLAVKDENRIGLGFRFTGLVGIARGVRSVRGIGFAGLVGFARLVRVGRFHRFRVLRPLCIEGGVRRDGGIKIERCGAIFVGVPAVEGVAFIHRVGGLGNGSIALDIDSDDIEFVFHAVEGHGVSIFQPLCSQGDVACRHGKLVLEILIQIQSGSFDRVILCLGNPAIEGVAIPLRDVQLDGRAIVIGFGGRVGIRVVDGKLVWVDIPSCIESGVSGDGVAPEGVLVRMVRVRIPTVEGVAFFGDLACVGF